MCRKILLTLMLFFSGFALKAQYPGYSLLTYAAAFKNQLATASEKTNSIQSDFVQEKNLSMLSEKIVSKGKFWFRKDNSVRMEYTDPFQYLMILSNGNVLIRDGEKENKISARSNKLFEQINKLVIDCVNGSALNNSDFNSRIFEGKENYLIELSPQSKNLKNYFKNIIVVIDKKDYVASTIEMRELSGDNTIIRFTNKELNIKIPDALFTIH